MDTPYPTVRGILELSEEVDDLFEGSEGEVTDEIADALAALSGDIDMKLGRLRNAHRAYSARAADLRDRAKSLVELARVCERRATTCERASRLVLEGTRRTSWDLPDGQVRLHRHRVVPCIDYRAAVDGLPSSLRRTPAPYQKPDEPDKTAIGKAIEAGAEVIGWRRERGVQWK